MQYFYCIIKTQGGDIVKKRITFTLDESTIEKLRETSEKTMIPQARLVERAIKEVIKKYDKE